MGCLVLLFSAVTPRVVLLFMWLFTDYLAVAYGSWFWPTLGFFVLPTTTIGFAIAENEFSTRSGSITATGVIVIVLAVALDLGLLGGSSRFRRGRDRGED
jgi:hypothetical protein